MFVTHHPIDIVTTPRGASDFTVHIPLSPHLTTGASLIHRRRGAEVIWGWGIALFMFCLRCFDLTSTSFKSADASWLDPSHYHPHYHPTPTTISTLKYIFPAKGCRGKKVRYGMQPLHFHLQIYFYFTHLYFALSNTTTKLYTTTKPHATINLQTIYYRISEEKR